uniref:RNA helicase n=1 Tax=Psoroptes ovis TaxID=83912 RepID=A0A3B0QPG8_PSOOV|nr:dosage compensation regulator [Psoroptes ovis]
MDLTNTRAALNLWCSKKKLKIDYDYSSIKIQSINHVVGKGTGSNKKNASQQAAYDAIQYLIQNKYITEKEFSQQCFEVLNVKHLFFGDNNNVGNNSNIVTQQNQQQQPQQPPSNNTDSSKLNNPKANWRSNKKIVPKNRQPNMNYYPTNNQHRPNYFDDPIEAQMQCEPCDNQHPSSNHYDERQQSYPGGHFESPYHHHPPNQHYDPYMMHDYNLPPPPPQTSHHYNYGSPAPYPNQYQPMPPPPNRKLMEVNDLQIRNLNLNDNNNSTQALMNMVNDAKKRRSDPDSARNRIDQIHEDCKFNLDNSKQQLNIFFQTHRIKADYQFSSFGPPHLKTFVAKIRFYVHKNKKEYHAEEKGNSKQDASRYCALNILHQLYKDNLIDSFDAEAPSKRQLMKMVWYFNVYTYHLAKAYNYIQSYNHYAQQLKLINPTLPATVKSPKDSSKKPESSFLYWCPPMENFNPWTNSNLDGTAYSNKTKQQINLELHNEFQTMIKSPKFQNTLTSRMKLPIWEHKERVIDYIENNPVVIIKGSTGCGKTTQVPQFILDSYIKATNGANCNIIVTQPRRISAISIAERVAFERGEELREGKYAVGYAVRFDHVYPRPYGSILFCTTGHLLRRIQGGLKGVSHVIIDEVHERDINTDLLLIIMRDLIRLDLNIHVVIMSATLGVSHFQKYLNCDKVMEIDSQLFPVRRYYLEDTIEMIRWKPKSLSYMEDDVEITDDIDNSAQFDCPEKISQNTINLLNELKEGVICFELIVSLLEYINSLTITGSILIFLPGWNSIFNLLNYLQRHPIFRDERKFLLLPLHSQLSRNDNNRIFLPSIQRKIILSTNIAETSITINDVVFVIDTCLMKRKIYDSKTNCTTYAIDWVSQSNIQQRQGRAGRVCSGYFFVLCTKRRYQMLEEFKKPEILVSSLLETSLLIKHLGLGSVSNFLRCALDPPSPKAIDEALASLRIINALDADNELTALGKILAKMPIDPRIGRMVIESILLNVASPIVTIAAASSINYEMFDNSDLNLLLETLIQLDEERYSDHLIIFKVFSMCDGNGNGNKNNNTPRSDAYRCINMNSVNVVRNARKQLVSILIKCGFNENLFVTKPSYLYSSAEFDIIAGLLVTAFYPNVCIHKDTRRILTNEERIGLIHKTSVFYSYVNNQKISRSKHLRSPVFIYSEKSQNKNLISSKQMTMVTFLQLLLFGIRTFEFPPPPPQSSTRTNEEIIYNDTVILDGWIELKIDAEVFDYIWLIKTEFVQLLSRVCENPDYVKTELDTTVLNSMAAICLFRNVEVTIIGK